jgi:hypothetical protein
MPGADRVRKGVQMLVQLGCSPDLSTSLLWDRRLPVPRPSRVRFDAALRLFKRRKPADDAIVPQGIKKRSTPDDSVLIVAIAQVPTLVARRTRVPCNAIDLAQSLSWCARSVGAF